mgnify:CR=1 FL=1
MIITNPSFEFITEQDPLKKIELCGRVCYKSENKITAESAESFVKSIIKRGHESVLEHCNIVMKVDFDDLKQFESICSRMHSRGYDPMLHRSHTIIAGNVRMWRDFMRAMDFYGCFEFPPLTLLRGVLFDDVNHTPLAFSTTAKLLSNDGLEEGSGILNIKTETVRFIIDRGISHEIVRHRMASYSQESTRYCNYSNDKFGNQITFIEPLFWGRDSTLYKIWLTGCLNAEASYFELLDNGARPQEARSVLPNSLKTELIMTATIKSWRHFFDMRACDTAAHPQMREIAVPLLEEFKKKYPLLLGDLTNADDSNDL